MKLDKLWLVAAVVLLGLAASLLRFKTILSGDSLFMEQLVVDLVQDGGRWIDWKFPVAPAFVPDMLLYFAMYPALPDAATRIFAVSVAQAAILTGTVLWFARQIYPALSRRAAAVMVLGMAFLTLTAARSSMWLYFYSTNNHLPAVLFGLAGLAMAMRYVGDGSRRVALAIVAITIAGCISTSLFYLTVVMPALLLLACSWLMLRGAAMARARRRVLLLAGCIAIGLIAADLLLKVLVHYKPLGGIDNIAPGPAGRAMTLFVAATLAAFDLANPYTFSLAVLLAAALLFLLFHFARSVTADATGLRAGFQDSPRIAVTGAMLGASLLLTLLGALLAGRFGDEYAYRYFTFPLLLAAVLAIVLLDRGVPRFVWDAVLLAGGALVLAGCLNTARTAAPIATTNPIADCLMDVERQNFTLRGGISDYWTGPQVRQFMPKKLHILDTYNDLVPHFWVTTIGPLLRPERYPQIKYNFALLRPRGDTSGFNYTAETTGKNLPQPSRVHVCQTGNEVWLYDGNELDDAVRKVAARYMQEKGIHR
ncbi:hypothetical protein OU994_27940 [Pseudoduganella sp. SL102]|uniref:hypothetical protein n=1 Tax=Pseudoduganella sp. SL102 TaxID=2995154 RepID=UPI00248CE91B|nr:hypothetical protein [Pseudoduganella sp. SL102]WBS02041.1 hypothetical protein OU994_27940 [Pseudoduganella sp. SL102]